MNDPRLRRNALGFLEVVDRPSPAELADYYARTYYQKESGNYRRSYPPEELEVIGLRVDQRATQALEFLGKDRPGSILDVGCGEGFVLAHFRALGWMVSGIDHTRDGVERANPECAAFVEQGDVFTLLSRRVDKGDRHDLVWLGNVLEHVLDPIGLLDTLRRLVAADGVLVATVPNDGTDYHEELFERGAIPERFWIGIPDHLSYFTAESLRATAEAGGWDCLALHGDFPVDWFLADEHSNYVADRTRGAAAHRARLWIERLIGRAGPAAANRFNAALAQLGFGRNLTIFLRPKPEGSRA